MRGGAVPRAFTKGSLRADLLAPLPDPLARTCFSACRGRGGCPVWTRTRYYIVGDGEVQWRALSIHLYEVTAIPGALSAVDHSVRREHCPSGALGSTGPREHWPSGACSLVRDSGAPLDIGNDRDPLKLEPSDDLPQSHAGHRYGSITFAVRAARQRQELKNLRR